MKYIKKFSTSLDYQKYIYNQSGHDMKPFLGYTEDMDYVYFDNQLDNETSDKRFALIGDWVLAKADGSKLFVGDKVYLEKYINSEEWTAIAKVVVPYNEFKDKTVRCISTKYMSAATPSTGSSSSTSIYWGSDSLMSSLYNCNNFFEFIPDTTTISISLITDNNYPHIANTFLCLLNNAVKSADPRISYAQYLPYNITVHTRNGIMPIILSADKSYYDGKYNTNEIKKLIPSNILEQSSIINNNSTEGNYPAVLCCLRYSTVGTQAGDWYLPSIYELLYVFEYSKYFDNVAPNPLYLGWTSSVCNNRILGTSYNGASASMQRNSVVSTLPYVLCSNVCHAFVQF